MFEYFIEKNKHKKMERVKFILKSRLKLKKELFELCEHIYYKKQEAYNYYLLTDVYDFTIDEKIIIFNNISKKRRLPSFEKYCILFNQPDD